MRREKRLENSSSEMRILPRKVLGGVRSQGIKYEGIEGYDDATIVHGKISIWWGEWLSRALPSLIH